MKAKIVSVKHYYAETENGETYDIDINNDILKQIIDKEQFIEGDIIVNEKQDQYIDSTYARSYTVTKTFVPHIKITNGDFLREIKITTEKTIPSVSKKERYNENKITLPKVDPNKVKLTNERTEPKYIKLKK